MIDTYIKSARFSDIAAFCSSFTNVLGPNNGREAEQLEDGSWNPAKGDPSLFYACVRAPFPVPVSGEISLADQADCVAVCGVWA